MEGKEVSDCAQFKRSNWSWSTCVDNDLQELQALIVSFSCKNVLLKRQEDRWVLPGRLYPRADFSSAFEPLYIIPDVQQLIDSDSPLTFLRQIWRRVRPVVVDNRECEYEKVVVLLDYSEDVITSGCGDNGLHSPTVDNDLIWIPVEQASVFHLIDEAAAVIAKELACIAESSQPQNRLSWQRPGWFGAATSWMVEQLSTRCDATLTDDVIQLRSSHLGIILKAETTQGLFFLKCTSPSSNDAAFTQTLATLSPSLVKSPVAVDVKKQLLLTADYGDLLSPFHLSEVEALRLTSDYTRLQMDTIGSVEELISVGVPDMRVYKLLDYVDRLGTCSLFGSLGSFEERVEKEVQFFRNSTQMIKKELMKLETSPTLPATVTHNDLFSSNIYWNQKAESYMFFDFVESYVSHPFAFQIGILDEKQYLREWSAKTGATINELSDLLSPGYKCHLLAVLVLRLQEAQSAEFPESEESLVEARRALRLFNGSMRQCLRQLG